MKVRKLIDYQYEAIQVKGENTEEIKQSLCFARGRMPIEMYDLVVVQKNKGIGIVDCRDNWPMLVPFGGYMVRYQVEDGRFLFYGFETLEAMKEIFTIED